MTLVIEDNGIGLESTESTYAHTTRLSLAGMQEQAETLVRTGSLKSSLLPAGLIRRSLTALASGGCHKKKKW